MVDVRVKTNDDGERHSLAKASKETRVSLAT